MFGFSLAKISLSDYLYTALAAGHLVALLWTVFYLAIRGKTAQNTVLPCFLVFKAPEILFTATLVLFLFSYIFALNANMDYVQRFIARGGTKLRLALDTHRERFNSLLRFLPFLCLDAFCLVLPRLVLPRLRLKWKALSEASLDPASAIKTWALPLTLLSAFLYAMSFPSFISLEGMPVLAYVALVPILLVLEESPHPWSVFYGVSFGVVQTMIVNYWLGTFSLISLQFVTVLTLLFYMLFMIPALWIFRHAGNLGFIVFPAAWVIFDCLRSQGFFGYPWGMMGTTQYAFIPLIQAASLTGIWGVSFIVYLSNSSLAWAIFGLLKRSRRCLPPILLAGSLISLCLAGGALSLLTEPFGDQGEVAPRAATIALVQQNSDPRKNDYEEVYQALVRLTQAALASKPELVVWSETAFVPNIRRWSAEDPKTEPLAELVQRFLAYQRGLGTWLLTGNDDYDLTSAGGQEVRYDYNASILFSPNGERVKTYHKIHLVPFTEYFPWHEQLPWLYRFLLTFDVNLWEPGRERVVFHHPRFAFSTPICFEDSFPQDIRLFVLSGAEAIINLSNDYWSLTEVEAKQHAVNAVFRAVENRRPLIRASASGLTCFIDTAGRIVAQAPFFSEAVLAREVRFARNRLTVYTKFGDWFPLVMVAILAACIVLGWRRQ